MIKLFSITSVAQNLWGYEEINFHWIVLDREAPVIPYEDAITDYGQKDETDRLYSQGFVDELFTEEEAARLSDYLLRVHNEPCKIKEVELPISSGFPISGVPLGGGVDQYSLYMEKGYDLPFKVVGHYDLRDCVLAGRPLAIKYNNAAVNDSCAICGGWTDPQIPLALFERDGYTAVCDPCGQKHAPEMIELLRYFYEGPGLKEWMRRVYGEPGPRPKDEEIGPDEDFPF